jgi:hypothetical protein
MPSSTHRLVILLVAAATLLLLLVSGACTRGEPVPTSTPTRTPRPAPQSVTPVPTSAPVALPTATHGSIATSSPVRTATPPATLTPTAAPSPTATEPPPLAPQPTATPSALPAATATPLAREAGPTPPPARPAQPQPVATQPPRRGGDWDLEGGFYAWDSLHEGFTAFVANGWRPLSKAYDSAAPPRLNENKFLPNVHSGERSQEISFDFRSGEAGIFRTAEVVPGHRYSIEAWAKYMASETGLQLYLGIDPAGGEDFAAGSVVWHSWRDMSPDRWVATQEIVRASGSRLTIFLRAVHPVGADGGHKPGGNTMFDDVSLVDLGQ